MKLILILQRGVLFPQERADMPNKRKQGGFGLIDVVLALSLTAVILATVIPMSMNYYKQKQVDEFITNIKGLIVQMQLYQFHRTSKEGYKSNPFFSGYLDSWPASFDALMLDYGGAFRELCGPMNEEAGICVRPDTLPFTTEKLRFKQVMETTVNKVFLVIPTSTLPNDGPRARWGQPLLALPDAQLLDNGDIQILLRPLTKTIMYDEFLRKDGSEHLTGDWDVGGEHAITNAKDYTIRNSDGSQQLVSTGLVKILQVNHGDWIDKPKCPEHQQPDLTLSIHTVTIPNQYTLTGSIKPYVLGESSSQWRAGLEVRVVINSTGRPHSIEDGVMTAFVQCK
nr:type II secretion system protein [Aliivibrio fischeri]